MATKTEDEFTPLVGCRHAGVGIIERADGTEELAGYQVMKPGEKMPAGAQKFSRSSDGKLRSPSVRSKPSTEAYRTGWEALFGAKQMTGQA